MGSQADNKHTWIIQNFASLQAEESTFSNQFIIGSCNWYLLALAEPNEHLKYCLSLYLVVADAENLPLGWRRCARFTFTIVNQTREEFSFVKVKKQWFDDQEPNGGFECMIPFDTLMVKDSGFVVNGSIKIVVRIEVLEVIGRPTLPADWVNVNGFQVHSSKAALVKQLFEKHPETALECRMQNQQLKSSYMDVLLYVINNLSRWPHQLTDDNLSSAAVDLEHMTSVGFKLDWLKKKLDQVKATKEKCTRVSEMQQQLNELEQKKKDLAAQINKEIKEIFDATTPEFPFNDVLG